MATRKKYKLIDGNFKPSEAVNILFALFNSKINYHNLESFRIQELINTNFEHHDQRAKELKNDYLLIKKQINEASEQGCHLSIKSNVEIELIPKK